MVCNDLVMPLLLRWARVARRAELTGLLLAVRRGAILVVLLLGYAYYHLAGEAYALVGHRADQLRRGGAVRASLAAGAVLERRPHAWAPWPVCPRDLPCGCTR
jgi:hypothetical protein